jgi:general stress protein YciG
MAEHIRGFATMDPEKHRQIAARGGRVAWAKGVAHRWSSKEAREAGRRGGLASHEKRRQRERQKEDGNG